MTIIAYKDGVMAADSCIFSAASVKLPNVVKVRKINDYLVGYSGDAPSIPLFFDWVERGMDAARPPFEVTSDRTFHAIVVSEDNKILSFDDDFNPLELYDVEMHATGDSYEFAWGALAAGASAIEAVDLTIEHCAYAGGDVNWISFETDDHVTEKRKYITQKIAQKRKLK